MSKSIDARLDCICEAVYAMHLSGYKGHIVSVPEMKLYLEADAVIY